MKKSIPFIVSILIFGAVTSCSETVEDKSATKKTKEQITGADKKSVVEKTGDKKDRNKAVTSEEWMAKGNEAYIINDYDKAIECYKKALTLNHDNAKAHYNLGISYSDKDMPDKSIIEWKKAIVINPNFAEAHNNLAIAYYEKKQYELAIKHCDKAIELGYNPHPEFLSDLTPYRLD